MNGDKCIFPGEAFGDTVNWHAYSQASNGRDKVTRIPNVPRCLCHISMTALDVLARMGHSQ